MKVSELLTSFRNPASEYGPTPAWWWSGDKLTKERIEWQLRQLHAGGVKNVVIFSLAPTVNQPFRGSPPDDPSWFSDAWWECFRHLCSVSKELGGHVWFYDHLGFGQLDIPLQLIERNPQFASRELQRVPSGKALPQGAEVIAERDGYQYLTAPLPNDRGWFAYDVYDLMQPEAAAALIDAIHGEFERRLPEYLGSVITGSFQDELHRLSSWTPALPGKFRDITGRAFEDALPALFETEPETGPVRAEYHRTLAALAEKSFFKPLHDWHEARGMIFSCDQLDRARAGDPFSATEMYHDYTRTHHWFTAPGNDHNGETKVHSSLAHLYKRSRVFFESFHSSGWGGTLEDTFRWLVPWLQQGVTLYHPHSVYYGTKGSWWEWAPPSTGWRQPYWKHYSHFAQTTARLCWLLSQGAHVCDVAVFYPTATMQAEMPLPSPTRVNKDWSGSIPWPTERARLCDETFWNLIGNVSWRRQGASIRDDRRDSEGVLARYGYDCDVIDEDSLQRSKVKHGRLDVADEGYRVVIFPRITCLPRSTLKKTVQFVQGGGTVVFVGCVPDTTIEGGYGDSELQVHLAALLGEKWTELGKGEKRLTHAHSGGGMALFVSDSEDVGKALAERLPVPVEGEVRALHRRVGDLDFFYLDPLPHLPPPPEREHRLVRFADELQPGDDPKLPPFPPAPERTTVRVRCKGPVTQWDPYTGERKPVRVIETDEVSTTVEVDLTGAPAGVLVFGDEIVAATSDKPTGNDLETLEELDGPWQFELVSTTENRYGDMDWPPHVGPLFVEVRRLQHVPGKGDGISSRSKEAKEPETVLATFAPFVEVSGPHQEEAAQSIGAGGKAEWNPYTYSRKYGIANDPVYWSMLGPKGSVLPDFLDFGGVETGDSYLVRTQVVVRDARRLSLRLGGRVLPAAESFDSQPHATVSVWINGEPVGDRAISSSQQAAAGDMLDPSEGILIPLQLQAGENELRLAWKSGRTGQLRGYFQFLPQDATPPYGHPLPEAHWLNPEQRGPVVPDLVIDPHPESAPRAATYRCKLPPGACRVHMQARGSVRADVDGKAVSVGDDGAADLPHPERHGRLLNLRVEMATGVLAGAAFAAPLKFDIASGSIHAGDWREQGLPHYAGGVTYRRDLELTDVPDALWLDLGEVIGSAEVRLNGEACGVRIWRPFRYELNEASIRGTNRLEITIYNTLGPHFADGHPSPYSFTDQDRTGLIGPVRLLGR